MRRSSSGCRTIKSKATTQKVRPMPRGVYDHTRKPLEERFWKYVMPEPNSGCWIWTGSLSGRGYGQIMDAETRWPVTAHTLSWRINRGPIPEGMHVLHHCDQCWCCNPDHLFLGTNDDNIRDAQKKGRLLGKNAPRGEGSGAAKLTENAVREIRASNEKSLPLATRFGVTQALISAVRCRKIWRHVE
jgi:HNH endonuclease